MFVSRFFLLCVHVIVLSHDATCRVSVVLFMCRVVSRLALIAVMVEFT